MSLHAIYAAVKILEDASLAFTDFLEALLIDPYLQESLTALQLHAPAMLNVLLLNENTKRDTRAYMMGYATAELKQQLEALTKSDAGYHFTAQNVSTEQIEACNIAKLSKGMERIAPDVWSLLGHLLLADPDIIRKREWARKKKAKKACVKPQKVVKDIASVEEQPMEDEIEDLENHEESDMSMDMDNERTDDCDIEDIHDGDKTLVESEDDELQESSSEDSRRDNSDSESVDEESDEEELDVGDSDEDSDEEDLGEVEDDSEETPDDSLSVLERRDAELLCIKKIVCMSVFMHSTNHRCNTLQAMVGLFLQSCCAPETVVELLAHLGLSISTTTIQRAVSSLSAKSAAKIRAAGSTLTTMYAYDNLDFYLKHATPTMENTHDTDLTHVTSASEFPLYHGVTPEDLDCGDQLRDIFKNPAPVSMDQIYERLSEEADNDGLYSFDRYRVWKVLADLVEYGPEYFRKFKPELGEPEEIDCIPVVKTVQIPMKAVPVSPNTPAANAEVLANLFSQASIGDPNDVRTPEKEVSAGSHGSKTSEDGVLVLPLDKEAQDSSSRSRGPSVFVEEASEEEEEELEEEKEHSETLTDIANKAVLIAGDLLTGQHDRSLMNLRSIEKTPFRRLSFMVYVLGLFHFKMACADAIWREFIQPAKSTTETNTLLSLIKQIRKNEIKKFKDNSPDFRSMHEVIQHVGIVARLDLWRIVIKEVTDNSVVSLEEWAATEPTWGDIRKLAHKIVKEHVAPPDMDRVRNQDDDKRDQVKENTMLFHRQVLLYEETSYAMNHGDIGRVEKTFLPWIATFTGCGKHKYAAELKRYLENIHFRYPKALR
ncbi:hypothetical protein NP233_g2 [Leucocoprinus birnbaumii]|uniref:DUF6589 domain-containing protein n=1 Tax=Leucocoprinus birnbaumii TaxID=56174 RepID=A0AAD5W327_9AGAR|nr:hypothetical protein NP233_g2 [Leucocoprinus birnbaumii]